MSAGAAQRMQEAIDESERTGGTAKFLVIPNYLEKEYLRAAPQACVQVMPGSRCSFNGLPVYASELAGRIHVF